LHQSIFPSSPADFENRRGAQNFYRFAGGADKKKAIVAVGAKPLPGLIDLLQELQFLGFFGRLRSE
jgi:hypothetical protein